MAELEEQLWEVGRELLDPPADVEELLHLLDHTELLLFKVEQSPQQHMSIALHPTMKALIAKQLFKHPDKDVKVHVASCLSEITRITSPNTPYNDELMKAIFTMIVEIFEDLDNFSSRSYSKKISILETNAKVRSCLLMLDLECDDLVLRMFCHFLEKIRKTHSNNVSASMEIIMTLIMEESEYISSDLVFCLLDSVKKNIKEAFPARFTLAKKVIGNCSANLRPCLMEIFQSKVVLLIDYSRIVTKICEGKKAENGNSNASSERMEPEKIESRVWLAETRNGAVQLPKPITGNSILDLEMANEMQQCWTSKCNSASSRTEVNEIIAGPAISNFSSVQSSKRARDQRLNLAETMSLHEERNNQMPTPFDLNVSPISDKKPDVTLRRRGQPPGSKNQLNLLMATSVDKERKNGLPTSLDLNASPIPEKKPDAAPRRRGRPPGSKTQFKKEDKDKIRSERKVLQQPSGITQKTSKYELSKERQTKKRKHKKGETAENNRNHSSPKPSDSPDKYQSNTEEQLMSTLGMKHGENQKDENLGEEMVHSRIKVWWPMDEMFYHGVINSFNPNTKEHKVVYDDGDVEFLLLKDERWEFVDDGSSGEEANHYLLSNLEICVLKRKRRPKRMSNRSGRESSTRKGRGMKHSNNITKYPTRRRSIEKSATEPEETSGLAEEPSKHSKLEIAIV